MPTLHLGVMDVPYGKAHGSKSTGDVAEILEGKYALFSKFVEMHAPVIEHVIANSLHGTIETALMGGPTGSAFATATSEIEELFKDALTMQSYDHRIPGVPTGAAQRGVSHRKKHPYASTNPPRPSFIDTGLFQQSFKAWTS